jgi:hypothetical protein
MKSTFKKTLALFIMAVSVGQGQTNHANNSQKQYLTLVENQKTPFLNSDGEVLIVEGVAWERHYGEKEYVLTPTMKSVSDNNQRIRRYVNPLTNVYKSKFHFLNVELNNLSKLLLKSANIIVPDYIQNNVNVYLPEIDIEILSKNNIAISYLEDYGKQKIATQKEAKAQQSPLAVIYSEGFEVNQVPSALYGTTNGSITNCGWGDVNCVSANTGSWSVWCARNGVACNSCGSSYKNGMDAWFNKFNDINTSAYQNLVFSFALAYKFYTIGSNDILYRYYTIDGTNYNLGSVSYNSASPNNNSTWNNQTFTLAGNFPVYNFLFVFYSNGVGTDQGVFIDDLNLSGTPLATGINEESNNLSLLKIYPNPNNGVFSVSNTYDIVLTITNEIGQKIRTISLTSKNNHKIEISDLSEGIYFITGNNGKEFVKEKIIVTK